MKRTFVFALAGLVLLLLVPVLLQLLLSPSSRELVGVSLEELSYQDVEFRNTRDNLQLAGMLFVPAGQGPHPAAVLIHGSGYSNRQNRWYLSLVEHLQRSGTLVLLPDILDKH